MNFNLVLDTDKKFSGKNSCEFVIVHHTGGGTFMSNSRYLSGSKHATVRDASSHYVIGESGQIAKIGKHSDKLWHVGNGKLPGTNKIENLNHRSVGIEIVSDGHIFTSHQHLAVKDLILYICRKTGIKPRNVLRHSDVSSYRGKWDVGPDFFRKFVSWKDYVESIFEFKSVENNLEFTTTSIVLTCKKILKLLDKLEFDDEARGMHGAKALINDVKKEMEFKRTLEKKEMLDYVSNVWIFGEYVDSKPIMLECHRLAQIIRGVV